MSNPAIPETNTTLSEALGVVVNGLCKAMQKQAEVDQHIIPICIRLWISLLHMTKRYERLVARFLAGKLTQPRPRAPRPRTKWPEPPRKPDEEPKRAETLPRTFGWLLKYVPDATLYADQLRVLLADPAMIAFLTAAPQAGRLLRPLCRTLGVALTAELLPPKKPEPEPGEPQPARAKKPDPCASETHADDPLWARPVSHWINPPRKRTPTIRPPEIRT